MNKLKIALFILLISTQAHADQTYDSIKNAIGTIKSQAYVYLTKGVYLSKTENVDIKWVISTDTRVKLDFFYGSGTIQSGVIDFGKSPTIATLKSHDGLCTTFKIGKVVIGEGGAIDISSDLVMIPDPKCTQHSPFQNEMDSFISFNSNLSEFLSGKPFSINSFCKEKDVNCISGKSSKTNPVAKVKFFTSTDSNGEPNKEAFLIRFKPNAVITLPNSNYLALDQGSESFVSFLEYDVPTNSGKAILNTIKFNIKNSELKFGDTSLNLTAGTKLSFDNMTIGLDHDRTVMSDGSISGALGDNSHISLNSANGIDSYIKVQSAELQLNGVRLDFKGNEGSLSGTSGSLGIISTNSKLALSNNLILMLQNANVKLLLACPTGSDQACIPFKWNTNGQVSIKGSIPGAAINLAQGGFFNLPGQNKLSIEGGNLISKTLDIDTDNKKTPITGELVDVNLRLAAQDWHLDSSTVVKAANFTLSSHDIKLLNNDPYPIGVLKFDALVSEMTTPGINNIRFNLATGIIKANITRDLNDDPKFEGSIFGNISAYTTMLDSSANVSLALNDIRFYKGFGNAKLDFFVESANTIYRTPPLNESQGVPGGKFELKANSIPISIKLANRVGFQNAEIKVDNGIWSMSKQLDIPINIDLLVPSMVAAHGQHYLGGGLVGDNYIETDCRPEVKTVNQTYRITGKIDFNFDGDHKTLLTRDFSINQPLELNLDTSNCANVAALACGIVGSILGPVSSLAAAVACGNEVNKQKEKFQNETINQTTEFIQKLNSSFNF